MAKRRGLDLNTVFLTPPDTIANNGPLDQSMGKLFHFIDKRFIPHKIMHIKEKLKEKKINIYLSFIVLAYIFESI